MRVRISSALTVVTVLCAAPAAVAKPDLQPGDTFFYKRHNGTTHREVYRGMLTTEGVHVTDLYTGGNSVIPRRYTRFMSLMGNHLFRYEPHLGYLTPNPAVGKSWKTRVREYRVGRKKKPSSYVRECRIEAREDITVPAGVFNTWKISCSSKWKGGGQKLVWWADTRTLMAVRFRRTRGNYTSSYELQSIRRAPR